MEQGRHRPDQSRENRETASDLIASLEEQIARLERTGISHAEILYELKHLLRVIKSDIGEGR